MVSTKKIITILNSLAFFLTLLLFYWFWSTPKVSDQFPFISGNELVKMTILVTVVNSLVLYTRKLSKNLKSNNSS